MFSIHFFRAHIVPIDQFSEYNHIHNNFKIYYKVVTNSMYLPLLLIVFISSPGHRNRAALGDYGGKPIGKISPSNKFVLKIQRIKI